MREFLVVFYGSEISMGFILASWLIWGAFGSGFLGRAVARIKSKIYFFSCCQFALGVLFPLSIFAIRWLKQILGFWPGEMIGFLPMALSSLTILAPSCILLGFMFSLGCRLYEPFSSDPAARITKVYIYEAIGSLIGGLLTSFLFIRLLLPFEIIAILSSVNIFFALVLLMISRQAKDKPLPLTVLMLTLVILVFIWFSGGWLKLDRYSLKKQWKGYELVASKNSIYGNIVISRNNGQLSFFNDGLHLYSVPDRLTAEQAVHFALLEHPQPKNVLIVGGGIGGLLEEALKHPLEKVDYVELDPLIINLAELYLSKQAYKPLEDPRIWIKNLDGRFFIKTTDLRYDCIIVHLGDPFTAQLNRYYTVEFFQEAKRVLNDGGVLSFALTGSENYLSQEQKDFLGSIYFSLKSSFLDIKVIPGDTVYFLASDKKGALTYDYRILMQRAKERGLDLEYVREYYLFSNLSQERIAYLENALGLNKKARINSDFRPISYYYAIVFWSTYFPEAFLTKALSFLAQQKFLQFILALGAVIFCLWFLARGKRGEPKKAALMALLTTGFSEMVMQVIILISFQIIYGYLFYKLGIILTCFMLGLVLGSRWIIATMPRLKSAMQTFIYTQLGLGVYILILPLVFFWLAGVRQVTIIWLGANIIFVLLPIFAGFIGGIQFYLANKIYLGERKDVASVSGLIYGVDLCGSCLGALLSGIFFIPLLGIPDTCLTLAALNLLVLTCLILQRLSPQEDIKS
jgi:spermidine synthase